MTREGERQEAIRNYLAAWANGNKARPRGRADLVYVLAKSDAPVDLRRLALIKEAFGWRDGGRVGRFIDLVIELERKEQFR
jgi:hypothetical protein